MMLTVTEEHMEVKDSMKREDAMVSMGGHLMEGDMEMEVTLGEYAIEVEDSLMMEGPPDDGGPPW